MKQIDCFIPGPVGMLAACVAPPRDRIQDRAQAMSQDTLKGRLQDTSQSPCAQTLLAGATRVGILCHPHPLYQGTLRNKVVTTLHKAMQNTGCTTVRFNFRGVEKSDGQFDHARGECDDLLSVMRWVKSQSPHSQCLLGGFSFGSYIAHRVASLHPQAIQALVTLAPVVAQYDFATPPFPQCPQLIVHGEKDEIGPVDQTRQWYEKYRNAMTQLIIMPDCSHFFHGKLIALRAHIEEFLSKWCV